MKKQGFTLTELLITLGLISAIVFLIAPTIKNIKPDDDKVKVLKVYNTLNKINHELLTDSSVYLQNNCRALNCSQQPLNPRYNGIQVSGNMKYPILLFSKLNTETIALPANLPATFDTADGLVWTIDGAVPNYTVTIDVEANGGADCAFANACQNPDRFIFNIDENGRVTGGDALTIAYLANPHKLNDRSRDILVAQGENPFENNGGGGGDDQGGQGGQGDQGQGGQGGQGQGGQGGQGQGGQGGQGGNSEGTPFEEENSETPSFDPANPDTYGQYDPNNSEHQQQLLARLKQIEMQLTKLNAQLVLEQNTMNTWRNAKRGYEQELEQTSPGTRRYGELRALIKEMDDNIMTQNNKINTLNIQIDEYESMQELLNKLLNEKSSNDETLPDNKNKQLNDDKSLSRDKN